MPFKPLLITVFFPILLLGSPGYQTPWGKDTDLVGKKKEITSTPYQSPAVLIAKKIILFHQKVLSPVDGPRSHFYPCSSQYMKLAMIKHGFIRGFFMGCDRLMREHKDPWVYRKVIIDGKFIKYDPPP